MAGKLVQAVNKWPQALSMWEGCSTWGLALPKDSNLKELVKATSLI